MMALMTPICSFLDCVCPWFVDGFIFSGVTVASLVCSVMGG